MNYQKLIDKFGIDEYLFKVLEELSELSVAVTHYRHGKCTKQDLAIEIADVIIQTEKLCALDNHDMFKLVIEEYRIKKIKLKGIINEDTNLPKM